MFKVQALAVRKVFLRQIFIILFLCLTIIVTYKTDTHATSASIAINGDANINHQWGSTGEKTKSYSKHFSITAKTDSSTGYQLYFSSTSEKTA